MTDDELTAAIREVQQRARARAPQGGLGLDGVEAADLMPLVHARDAAQAKVAAIGTVNPRPPGLMNSTVQAAKRAAARALDWHVREQVEFNRAVMACVEASLAAMTGVSRSVAALSAHMASDRARQQSAVAEAEAHQKELYRHVRELHALGSGQAAALQEFRNQQAALIENLQLQWGVRVEELRREHHATVEQVLAEQKVHVAELRREHVAQIETLGQEHAAQLDTIAGEHAAQLEAIGRDHVAQMETLRHEHGTQVEALRYEYGAQVEAFRREYGAQVEAFRNESGTQAEQFRIEQGAHFDEWRTRQDALLEEMQGKQTVAAAGHQSLEERVAASEIQISRTVAKLEAAYQQHLAHQEEVFRDLAQAQHRDFTQALEHNTLDVQKRLWEDLARVREEFEGLIHRELRLLRQRESLPASAPGSPTLPAADGSQAAIGIDWLHFAERFRGSEARIREQQQRYVGRFAGTEGRILDIGCGRGEFLAALGDAGLHGLGIDANAECVALCRSRGLLAECTDLFAYLEGQADGSLAGVYCAQVIEHLAPAQVAHLVRLLGVKMRAGAWVAIETPNPESLAIFATYFYADPTHTRPVPAPLLRFYLEEAGFGSIAVEHMNPAADVIPAIGKLPAPVREALFGALDYAIFARKL